MKPQDPGLSKKSEGLPGEQVAECESILMPSTFITSRKSHKTYLFPQGTLATSQCEKGLKLSFPFPDLLTFS